MPAPVGPSTHGQAPAASPESDALLEPVSRRVATLWNAIFWYVANLLVLARNIVLVPVYFRYIGKDEYNAWLVSGFVLTQLTNVDFGLMGVLGQRVAAAYGDRQRARLERLVGGGLATVTVLAALLGLVTAAVSPFVPRFFDVTPEIAGRLRVAFLGVALANSIQLFAFGASGLLRALQRPLPPGVFMVLSELTGLTTTAILVVHGFGLYSIVAGLVVRSTVEAVGSGTAFWWIAFRRLRLRPGWDRAEAVSLWRLSSYQFLTQLAGRFKQSLDSFVLGAMLGTQAGGGYALTIRAHESVRMFSAGVVGAAAPALAHLHGGGEVPRLRNVVLRLFELQALIAAIGFGGVIAFNAAFMRLWVGPDVFSGQAVSVVAALACIAWLLSTAPYETVVARGGFSTITQVVWVEVVLRFLAMALLIKWVGVLGTPIASLACQVLVILLPLGWIVVQRIHISSAELLATLAGAAKRMALSLGLAALISLFVPPAPSWPIFVAEAALYVAAASIGTWLIDPELVRFLRRGGREPEA